MDAPLSTQNLQWFLFGPPMTLFYLLNIRVQTKPNMPNTVLKGLHAFYSSDASQNSNPETLLATKKSSSTSISKQCLSINKSSLNLILTLNPSPNHPYPHYNFPKPKIDPTHYLRLLNALLAIEPASEMSSSLFPSALRTIH